MNSQKKRQGMVGIDAQAMLLAFSLGCFFLPVAAWAVTIAGVEGGQSGLMLPQAPSEEEVVAKQTKLRVACPSTAEKSISQRQQVQGESLCESLGRLGDLSFYVQGVGRHPSVSLEWPADDSVGQWEMQQVVTNRRVSKVITELAKLDPADASKRISCQIEKAISDYSALGGGLLRNPVGARSAALSRDTTILEAPKMAFATENGPNNATVLKGARLELFSLAFVVGYLHLADASEAMLSLALQAKAQRDILYMYKPDAGVPAADPSKPVDMAKPGPVVLLHCYGLYNRVALASGLLGCLDAETRAVYLNSLGAVDYPMGSAFSVVTPYDNGVDVVGPNPAETVQAELPREIPDVEIDRLIDLVSKRLVSPTS